MANPPGAPRPQNDYVGLNLKSAETSTETSGNFKDMKVGKTDPKLNVSTAPRETSVPEKKSLMDRLVATRIIGRVIARVINWAIKHDLYSPKFPDRTTDSVQLLNQLNERAQGTHTERLDLSGLVLKGAKLGSLADLMPEGKAVISNVDFSGADLRGLDLSNVRFQDCNFSHADLAGCTFAQDSDQYHLVGCSFDHCKLQNVEMSGMKIKGCDFSHASMKACQLRECSFKECETDSRTSMNQATVIKCDLRGLPLNEVILLKSTVSETKVHALPLSGNMNGSILNKVAYDRATLPTGNPAIGVTFHNMSLKFNPKVELDNPSFIPFAKFSGCTFNNCEMAMNNMHYLVKGCKFHECPSVQLKPGSASQFEHNQFIRCKEFAGTNLQGVHIFDRNNFLDSGLNQRDTSKARYTGHNHFRSSS